MTVTKAMKQLLLATTLLATPFLASGQKKIEPVKMPQDPVKEKMIAEGKAKQDYFFYDLPVKLDYYEQEEDVTTIRFSVPDVLGGHATILLQQKIDAYDRDGAISRRGVFEETLQLHESRFDEQWKETLYRSRITKNYKTNQTTFESWQSAPNAFHIKGAPNIEGKNNKWIDIEDSRDTLTVKSEYAKNINIAELFREVSDIKQHRGKIVHSVGSVMKAMDDLAKTGQREVEIRNVNDRDLVKSNELDKRLVPENIMQLKLDSIGWHKDPKEKSFHYSNKNYDPAGIVLYAFHGIDGIEGNIDGKLGPHELTEQTLRLTTANRSIELIQKFKDNGQSNLFVRRITHSNGQVQKVVDSQVTADSKEIDKRLKGIMLESAMILDVARVRHGIDLAEEMFPITGKLEKDMFEKPPEPPQKGHNRFGVPDFNNRNGNPTFNKGN